jgi:peptidoglycan/LPS O-acetylase OafA/YrhL
MKKAILVFIIAALVLISTGLWIYYSRDNFKPMDLLQFGVILLVILFALFVGFKRLTSTKRGEPAEDELSKKVLQKTSSLSYYISLYLWVGMIFVNDRLKIDTEELIGMGILGMALTFAICWLVFNFRGIRNE